MEELLLVEAASPPAQVAQPAAAAVYMVSSGAGEGTPMYAYPVRCPDGRVMYHLIPAAQRAVRAYFGLHVRLFWVANIIYNLQVSPLSHAC